MFAGIPSSTLGYAPGLAHKHYTRLERLARDKQCSLLRKYINYGRKKFYRIGPSTLVSSLGKPHCPTPFRFLLKPAVFTVSCRKENYYGRFLHLIKTHSFISLMMSCFFAILDLLGQLRA